MLGELSLVTYWRGMTAGDPVAWGITIGLIALFAFGLYWDNRRRSDVEPGKDDSPDQAAKS